MYKIGQYTHFFSSFLVQQQDVSLSDAVPQLWRRTFPEMTALLLDNPVNVLIIFGREKGGDQFIKLPSFKSTNNNVKIKWSIIFTNELKGFWFTVFGVGWYNK